MENRNKQDCIWAWYQLVNQYETDGNRNVRIKRLENVIQQMLHCHFKGGLFKWVQDYETGNAGVRWTGCRPVKYWKFPIFPILA
jgi:hypothetical protein